MVPSARTYVIMRILGAFLMAIGFLAITGVIE